jgi:hypothetical protein
MEEDELDAGKKRDAHDARGDGLNGHPNTTNDGALAAAEGSGKVGALTAQFEPVTSPSPIPVRDLKRKKTTEIEEGSANSESVRSMQGRRQDQ